MHNRICCYFVLPCHLIHLGHHSPWYLNPDEHHLEIGTLFSLSLTLAFTRKTLLYYYNLYVFNFRTKWQIVLFVICDLRLKAIVISFIKYSLCVVAISFHSFLVDLLLIIFFFFVEFFIRDASHD